MAHEILSVKLYELEKKIEQLCGRIQISESASHDRIKAETETLRREYAENGPDIAQSSDVFKSVGCR